MGGPHAHGGHHPQHVGTHHSHIHVGHKHKEDKKQNRSKEYFNYNIYEK